MPASGPRAFRSGGYRADPGSAASPEGVRTVNAGGQTSGTGGRAELAGRPADDDLAAGVLPGAVGGSADRGVTGYHYLLCERRNPGQADPVHGFGWDAAVGEHALEQGGDRDALIACVRGIGQATGEAEFPGDVIRV